MKIILILYIISNNYLFSQKEIQLIFNGNNTQMMKFEVSFVKALIDNYSERSGINFKIKYKGVKNFGSTFVAINKSNKDHSLAINTISITKERKNKYDFSKPYLKNSYALLSTKNVSETEKKIKIGYVKNTIYDDLSKQLTKSFTKSVSYDKMQDCIAGLKKGEFDLIFTDFTDAWVYGLHFVRSISGEVNDQFGILYPKGSKLKEELDQSFDSYYKSKDFFQLVQEHLGEKAVAYFQAN